MGKFAKFPFWKVQSTGNDFIVVDLTDESKNVLKMILSDPDRVAKLCRRRFGVGADGVVLLESSESSHLKWSFLNADGSSAEMCGNASRAVAAVGFEILGFEERFVFESLIGPIECEKLKHGYYRCSWTIPLNEALDMSIQVKGVKKSQLIQTGVPHLVLELDHWPAKSEVRSKVKSLRRLAALGPGGANVTLCHPKNDVLHAITFERGVEDFTLSCGTGVIAAAISYAGIDLREPLEVLNPGGLLAVEINPKKSRASLSGPAEIIFEGFLNKDLVYE